MSSDPEKSNDNNFTNQLADLISKKNIDSISDMQKSLLNRFEKSNQMLVYCNELSNQHFLKLSKDFRSHTLKLNEMYKDLNSIFHRIRLIKQKLGEKYPNVRIDRNPFSIENLEEQVEDEEKVISVTMQDLIVDSENPKKPNSSTK